MPSIIDLGNGRWIIQTKASGQRKSIRVNGLQWENRGTLRKKIRHLEEAAALDREPDAELVEWLRKLAPEIRSRFFEGGLVARRFEAVLCPKHPAQRNPRPGAPGFRPRTIGAFLTDYVERRVDAKPNTIRHMNDVCRKLREFFGHDVPLREITRGHAADWRAWLKAPNEKGKVRSENTVSRWCGRAKQFFAAAIASKLIQENPFDGLRTRVRANRARMVFIDRDLAARVFSALPDAQWRLFFALLRYGGLRCPSEVIPLTWGDVHLSAGWLHVRSPKTERHDGHAERWVPIFPELRPYLAALMPNEQDPEAPVITISRNPRVNFGTQFTRYLRRAGIKPWEKLLQNLRSTRQTELQDHFPPQTVSAWMGNSQAVAMENYLQVTDGHVARALKDPTGPMPESAQGKGGRCKRALQTPISPPEKTRAPKETPRNPRNKMAPDGTGLHTVPPVGLEGPGEVDKNRGVPHRQ